MQPLPLEGVRVLDLTRLLPGPLAGRRLAEMGAEVIKIEDPGPGDYARTIFRSTADEAAGRPGAFYRLLNRGKRIERLNLKDAPGRETLLGWVESADILIEGFRPGVMARLGLDCESLRQRNARLVYCAISGYGQHGAWSDKAGHDINYIGMAGVLDQLTDGSDAPIVPNFQIGDLFGGTQAAVQEILAALFAAQRTGHGRFVDVSMTHAVFRSNVAAAVAVNNNGVAPRARSALLNGGVPCYNVYPTSDGRWMAVGALELKFWQSLCDVIGKTAWKSQHWTLGQAVAGDEARAITAELTVIFLMKTQDEWTQLFDAADCCVTPILTLQEALEHPLFAGDRRGLIAEALPLR